LLASYNRILNVPDTFTEINFDFSVNNTTLPGSRALILTFVSDLGHHQSVPGAPSGDTISITDVQIRAVPAPAPLPGRGLLSWLVFAFGGGGLVLRRRGRALGAGLRVALARLATGRASPQAIP
jgi:hypothetical protein